MAENLEAPATIPSIFASLDRPHPMASSLPVWRAAEILAHPGRLHWEAAEDGCMVYIDRASDGKGRVIFWVTGDPEQQPSAPLSGEEALAALKSFDIRAVPMHLLYAAYATTLKRPWEAGVTITGQQIAEYLGLTKRKDMNQQDKLNLVLHLARQPAQLLVHVDWPAIGKREAFTVDKSRLWHIKVTYNGQKTPSGREKLRNLEIQVKSGPWAEYFLNQHDYKKGKVLYQYGYLTQNLLKAMMNCWQQQPGALRLMIWSLFKSRTGRPAPNKVSTLMDIAYGREILDQVQGNRRRRSALAMRWDNDLRVLADNGWTIEFDLATYLPHLRPDWKDLNSNELKQRPFKYFNDLLRAKCVLRPPAEIESALLSITSKKAKRRTHRERQSFLTNKEICDARLALGWKQVHLARAMDKSRSWVGMIENGRRQASYQDDERLRQVLRL